MRSLGKNKGSNGLGERGIATVYFVLFLLFFIVPLFALAIDFAYVYFVRGQLQNAADSAALAGASQLDELLNREQQDARDMAKTFAAKNYASGEPVYLENLPGSDAGSNTISGTNDTTVGYWDGATFHNNTSPFNAVHVVARRTSSDDGGSVKDTFGMLLTTLIDPVSINVADATAFRTTQAEAPFALCQDSCSLSIPPGGKLLHFAPGTNAKFNGVVIPNNEKIAWTTFNTTSQASTSTGDIVDFICDRNVKDACKETIYTTAGTPERAISEFRCAFKDPTYDAINKQINPSTSKVESWTLIVPILDHCPPSNQGLPDPYDVLEWGQITITEIYPQNESACSGCCADCTDYFPIYDGPEDYAGGIQSQSNKIKYAIRISSLGCEDCETSDLLARKFKLVQ